MSSGGNMAGAVMAGVGGSALGAAAQIANATNSFSNGWGNSWDSGGSWQQGSGVADSYGYSQGDSYSYGNSMGYGQSEGYSRTFGREASAQDIQRAAEANAVQRDLWSLQAAYNAKQAQIDRDYQTQMSNTAYQRAVQDLLKAGLNPILAAGNLGASTPVGAMASSAMATANKANTYAESQSANKAYNYNQSHNESQSKYRSENQSHSESQNSGSSWNEGGSYNEQQSQTTTQLKELGNIIHDLTTAGSAKTVSSKTTGGIKKGTAAVKTAGKKAMSKAKIK